MNRPLPLRLTTAALFIVVGGAWGQVADPHLREVPYDAHAVVIVPVQRGVVTHIVLEGAGGITEVASGVGGDCAKPEASWCIAAPPGGRSIYVKPKSTANPSNNLAVVTDRRSYSFNLVLADGERTAPLYRLTVKAPVGPKPSMEATGPVSLTLPMAATTDPTPQSLVAERLKAAPRVVNWSYSIAEGKAADDIVPTLIFDDGRFTYLRFPGNREIPAVFQVLVDGSETIVNTRMEGDLLVVDRVGRRLMLRSGMAAVGVWNEAFDPEGTPPVAGTTVSGVARASRSASAPKDLHATTGANP